MHIKIPFCKELCNLNFFFFFFFCFLRVFLGFHRFKYLHSPAGSQVTKTERGHIVTGDMTPEKTFVREVYAMQLPDGYRFGRCHSWAVLLEEFIPHLETQCTRKSTG